MATQQNTGSDRDESRARRTSSSSSSSQSRRGKGMSTETIIDIIERLGVVDLVVERVRGRIQEMDTDELMDDVTDYLKRNPEVLVVALGTITIAAGIIVFLSRREAAHFGTQSSSRASRAFGGDEADEMESTRRTAQAARKTRSV